MSTQIVNLDRGNVITLPLSDEITNALGLEQGALLTVKVEGRTIILQPLLADSLEKLHGIFTSETDAVEELRQERRQDKW